MDMLMPEVSGDVVKAGMAAAIGQSGYTSAAEMSLSIRCSVPSPLLSQVPSALLFPHSHSLEI
jgi:hypothetical protein